MPAFFCNCTAEAVPAQRTPSSSALKNVVLIFLFMIVSFLVQLPGERGAGLSGLAAMKLHMPVVAPGLLKTQAQPRMLGHPVFLVQKPRQTVLVEVRYNCRADTVPAQSTAMMSVVSNEN